MADTTGILMHEIEKIHSYVYKEYLHFLKEDFNVCIREKITKPFDRFMLSPLSRHFFPKITN